MARLFLPNGLRGPLLSARDSALSTPRAAARVKQQQQRSVFTQRHRHRHAEGSKSRLWVCGVGAGVALAVGLKYSACDDKAAGAEATGRYSAAVLVSRDLVERIQVGTEVGPSAAGSGVPLTNSPFALTPPPAAILWVPHMFCVVSVCCQAEVGAPGLVVGVSVDGAQVWCEGIGFADLENRVPCSADTVMRIASISKPLTSAAAARLCEEGKLDLEVPVQNYVPDFPQKQFDGEDVTITPRMILSHLSGIRHYEKDAKKVKEDREKALRLLKPPVKEKEDERSSSENRDKATKEQNTKNKEATLAQKKKEFEHEEYYLKDNFESVTHALDLFKDDPLIFKPGTTFLYSTHAFTLLSAVVERAAGQHFLDVMMNLFRELGMLHTVPDENDPIIYHRSRYYHLNKRGRVVNCPYVDNSYKWAGGGFLSTVGDLLLFGNALLYSYQVAHLTDTEGLLPGFLKPQTAIDLWAPVDRTEASWDKDGMYAQGWLVVEKLQKYGECRKRRHYVSHTGGAVGASSVLLVLPSAETEQRQGQSSLPPQGVVVTIITNMQSVGLNSTALKIAHEFDKARRL
ncbi:serine beta-lactamase-like protein LACTB, mitochondrial isoform X1 [Scophthalmus maximus]|uniref:serine beta-lactamase-like protein LACTB, mitochondrial isoform X1 n=1 Tax=Scophthalmus maximus TaxID=52904 RepID=UPI001FA81C17|nr:serine beta-lactamase-like protein LACTB, mitochondrial isoform X1 [Scophthalmus maximus]XP_047189365.1 serine beta-lactamase-like protein LACTB, mitochondrial isoform X1 [Scophthalmus maximus]